MRFVRQLILSALLVFSFATWSQNVKIAIPAGTPEDKDLSAIAAEGDAQKRIASYEEFITEVRRQQAGAGLWRMATLDPVSLRGRHGQSAGVRRQGAGALSQQP